VVSAAQETDVLGTVVATHGERIPMMKLELLALGTAAAVLVDEAAPANLAFKYSAPRGSRNVPRPRGRRHSDRPTRVVRSGESPRLETLELLGGGALDDRGQVAVGNLRPHEGSEALELVSQRPASGEFQLVTLRSQGFDDCGSAS